MEIWSVITEVANYQISSQGRVRNVRKGNILTPSKTSRGYLQVCLRNKAFRIHRLVAIHFIENPNGYIEVNHKDGNKLNNIYTNLEWCTRHDNLKHAYTTGLRIPSHQKRVVKCSLGGTEIEEYISISQAARINGIIASNITKAVRERTDNKDDRHTAGGYKWKLR